MRTTAQFKKTNIVENNFKIGAYISDAANYWLYVLSAYAKLFTTAKFSKNIVEEIRDLTENDIGQILWGHWVEIGDIGQTLGKLGRNWGLG